MRSNFAALKNASLKIKKVGLFICPFSLLIFNGFARSQPIVPAADGTGTAVTPSGKCYDIKTTISTAAVCRETGQIFFTVLAGSA
ncbi:MULTISPECIES: hypothetical protein [unclassified Microcoleus]|uniref:hypothetical protein n=1 Tax=unclassified Microcoleus TaxID=2642155 RepID=UPI002FD0C159